MTSKKASNENLSEASNLTLQTRRGTYLRNETDPRLRCTIFDGVWPSAAPESLIATAPNWAEPNKGGNLQLLQSDSSDDSPTTLDEFQSHYEHSQTDLDATETEGVANLGDSFQKMSMEPSTQVNVDESQERQLLQQKAATERQAGRSGEERKLKQRARAESRNKRIEASDSIFVAAILCRHGYVS